MATHASHLRTDFATAWALSTIAVLGLTGFLLLVGWPPLRQAPSTGFCSITSCAVSRDGTELLFTYWKTDQGGDSLRHGLAGIDLRELDPCLRPLPTRCHPWRLTRVGGDAFYVVHGAGQVALQSVVHNGQEKGERVSLPKGCAAETGTSTDGQTFVTLAAGTLQAFDVKRQAVRWEREKDVEAFALHPTRGLIASVRGEVVQLSLETGAVVRTIARSAGRIRLLAVDHSGESLAWLDWSGGVEVRRLRDGALVWRQAAHAGQTLPPSHRPALFGSVLTFSADGRRLATSACEGEWVLGIWDAKTGTRLKTLRGHDDTINGAAFLPDGSLASWSADGTLRLWNVRRGVVRRVFAAHSLPVLVPADRPGGDKRSQSVAGSFSLLRSADHAG
jgi:hypothetical protein